MYCYMCVTVAYLLYPLSGIFVYAQVTLNNRCGNSTKITKVGKKTEIPKKFPLIAVFLLG